MATNARITLALDDALRRAYACRGLVSRAGEELAAKARDDPTIADSAKCGRALEDIAIAEAALDELRRAIFDALQLLR